MTAPSGLAFPKSVLEIARTLEDAGFETWCVGGALRDVLLGDATPQEFDLATAATPAQVVALFRRTAQTGEKYGTIGVIGSDRVMREVTTFRRDVATDGRHAVVSYGVSIEEDLARRDFTVNALAYHPFRQQWLDPFDGRGDLERRLLRAVGDPALRFREDYLRILRGIRFAARFGFTVEPATWKAAVEAAPGLAQLSAERVRDEWFKALRTAGSVARLVDLWRRVGAAERWLPELAAAPDARLTAVDRVPLERRDPVLLSALLVVDAAPVLRRLRASNAETERAAAIARGPAGPAGTDARAVRRWLSTVGKAADDLLELHRLLTGAPAPWAEEVAAARARHDPLARGDLAIDGRDLQALGLAGPRLGEMLGLLLERVLDDPTLNTPEALLAIARERA